MVSNLYSLYCVNMNKTGQRVVQAYIFINIYILSLCWRPNRGKHAFHFECFSKHFEVQDNPQTPLEDSLFANHRTVLIRCDAKAVRDCEDSESEAAPHFQRCGRL